MDSTHGTALDADLVSCAQQLAGELAELRSPGLRDTLAAITTDAEPFNGRTIPDALRGQPRKDG